MNAMLMAFSRARDLVKQGQKLVSQLNSNGKGATDCSEQVKLLGAIKEWRRRFGDLIDDNDLAVKGDSKGILGVPRAVSEQLWDLEAQLSTHSTAAEKSRETLPT